MPENTSRLQLTIYSVILLLIVVTFPFWATEKPLGVLNNPIEGNKDLLYFGTDAPDNILIYAPGLGDTVGHYPASERMGALIVSPDGRTVWTATKSGFMDRYEIPLNSRSFIPRETVHLRIAPVLGSIAISSDNRFVAVAYANEEDYNSRNVKILPADTLDPRDELADFAVSGDIQEIVANPATNLFYIINSHSDRVRIYNSDRFRLEADIIELGNSPGQFVVKPDGKRAYGAMNARKSVTIVDLETNEVMKNLVLGFPPYAMCFNADGTRLYVASRDSNTVAIINTDTSEVESTFDLPPRVKGLLEYVYPEFIGVSSDERYFYVLPKHKEILVYDLKELGDTTIRDPKPRMIQSRNLSTDPFTMLIVHGK